MAGKKRNFACAVNLATLVNSDCYFDVLGSLVIILDREGKIRLFNSGAEEMLGYKSSEVLGKNWFNIFLPKEIVTEIKSVFKGMIQGDKKFLEDYTNEVLAKDGTKKILKWHTSILRDEAGKPEGIVSSAVDITDLVQEKEKSDELEVKTKNSELMFRSINEAAKDPIVMMDSVGNIVSWNRAAEGLFGYSESEVLGKNLHHLIVTKKEHEKKENILRFGKTGQSKVLDTPIELPVKNRQGQVIQIELTISRVKLFDRWHAVGIMRDITLKKAQEKDLEEKINQLERLNDLMIGREIRMVELKNEIAELKKRLPGKRETN